MRFGAFLLAAQFPGQDHTAVLESTVAAAVAAEEAGFDDVWVAEHHFMSYGICPSAITLAGYLLGAYLTSIGLGMAIVFSFHQSSGVESSKKTLSPLEDLVFGAILLIVGWVLLSGRAARAKERRKLRHEQKHPDKESKQSFPERMLGRGSVRLSFVAGALLSLPGASYFVALDKIAKLDWPTATTALAVIVFVLIEMLLLEVPLFGFYVAPEWTARAVVRFRAWISANAVRAGGWVAITLGCLLIIRGAAYLIASEALARPRRAPEPHQAPPPGMSNADVDALYAKYVKAKQTLGEEAGPGAYGKLLKTINAQAPKIMEQYQSKGVDFSVVVKDNQVIIRAKPKP